MTRPSAADTVQDGTQRAVACRDQNAGRGIEVEVIEGAATAEQRAALRRFTEWYRAKAAADAALKAQDS